MIQLSGIKTPRLIAALFCAVLFGVIPCHGENEPESAELKTRPNLLLIMTDQQRFDALSYAGNRVLLTARSDLKKHNAKVAELEACFQEWIKRTNNTNDEN